MNNPLVIMHIPQQALGYSLVHYKLQIAETFDTLTLAKTPELCHFCYTDENMSSEFYPKNA